jgi:hypothetical protein
MEHTTAPVEHSGPIPGLRALARENFSPHRGRAKPPAAAQRRLAQRSHQRAPQRDGDHSATARRKNGEPVNELPKLLQAAVIAAGHVEPCRHATRQTPQPR